MRYVGMCDLAFMIERLKELSLEISGTDRTHAMSVFLFHCNHYSSSHPTALPLVRCYLVVFTESHSYPPSSVDYATRQCNELPTAPALQPT